MLIGAISTVIDRRNMFGILEVAAATPWTRRAFVPARAELQILRFAQDDTRKNAQSQAFRNWMSADGESRFFGRRSDLRMTVSVFVCRSYESSVFALPLHKQSPDSKIFGLSF